MGLRDPVVCIVGAGTAGLVTAHLLQRAGISFVVLERQEADGLRARVKAGLIEYRTVELLSPYGLADPIVGAWRADWHDRVPRRRAGLRAGLCQAVRRAR